MLFVTRVILAVCYGLQKKCPKDSLHLEHFFCKTLQTIGQKTLNVSQIT